MTLSRPSHAELGRRWRYESVDGLQRAREALVCRRLDFFFDHANDQPDLAHLRLEGVAEALVGDGDARPPRDAGDSLELCKARRAVLQGARPEQPKLIHTQEVGEGPDRPQAVEREHVARHAAKAWRHLPHRRLKSEWGKRARGQPAQRERGCAKGESLDEVVSLDELAIERLHRHLHGLADRREEWAELRARIRQVRLLEAAHDRDEGVKLGRDERRELEDGVAEEEASDDIRVLHDLSVGSPRTRRRLHQSRLDLENSRLGGSQQSVEPLLFRVFALPVGREVKGGLDGLGVRQQARHEDVDDGQHLRGAHRLGLRRVEGAQVAALGAAGEVRRRRRRRAVEVRFTRRVGDASHGTLREVAVQAAVVQRLHRVDATKVRRLSKVDARGRRERDEPIVEALVIHGLALGFVRAHDKGREEADVEFARRQVVVHLQRLVEAAEPEELQEPAGAHGAQQRVHVHKRRHVLQIAALVRLAAIQDGPQRERPKRLVRADGEEGPRELERQEGAQFVLAARRGQQGVPSNMSIERSAPESLSLSAGMIWFCALTWMSSISTILRSMFETFRSDMMAATTGKSLMDLSSGCRPSRSCSFTFHSRALHSVSHVGAVSL
mmetsp:Transcript_27984/g.99488  ORF Transcript_27984/g.99488 Transcript_27984/m.99488 type:complete len:612 (-) Transcript_27984:378-2213(-)